MFLWFFVFVTRACCDGNLFRESSLWPKKMSSVTCGLKTIPKVFAVQEIG